MGHDKIGPREAQLRAMREAEYERREAARKLCPRCDHKLTGTECRNCGQSVPKQKKGK